MLERIPTVLTGQEILDKGFMRANKIDIPDPVRYHRIRKTEAARMQCVVDVVSDTLRRYPQAFPNLDNLRDYDREVLDIICGFPKLKKSLGSVLWAANKTREVGREAMEAMMKARSVDAVKGAQKRCYGRISSLCYEVDADLDLLRDTREKAKLLPSVSPDFATVVIAGYPNVGKSSLLTAWTRATPEIASYSFTTKKAEVGHFDVDDGTGNPTRYQVVDTPGLLDRPEDKRNDIEKQAVAALRHAADAVLFLLDPSETSGYSLAQQEHLLEEVTKQMHGLPLVVAETKVDIWNSGSDRLKFSTVTGEGLDELRAAILEVLPTEEELIVDEDPLARWQNPQSEDPWEGR